MTLPIKELIIIFCSLVICQRAGIGQILIGGEKGNTIYSSVVNQVEYVGGMDCEDLLVKIEGYDEKIEPEDCVFEINGLRLDTSRLQILNRLDEVIFDTILLRDKNSATGYLKIGDNLYTGGTIKEESLRWLDKVQLKYEYPGLKEPVVYGFRLIIVNEEGQYLAYEIKGSKVPNVYKEEISQLKNPTNLYIEQINWRPISCFERINSIVLDIVR